jgi:hypothetical protein
MVEKSRLESVLLAFSMVRGGRIANTLGERLRLVFISMEGLTVHKFRFWLQRDLFSSWDSLAIVLIRRFGDKACGVFERLK